MKKIVVNLLLVVVAVTVSLLGLEFSLALIAPRPLRVTAAEWAFFLRFDSDLGWRNRAGAEGVYRPAPGIPATTVRINANGYRGGAYPPGGKPGRFRTVILGDSNTFGYGVEEGDRFSDIIASSFKSDNDMLNFGVFGYGTDQEAMLLEREVLGYRPNLVILAVSAGDLSDVTASISGGTAKPFFSIDEGVLTLHNTPVPERTPYMRNRWSRSDALTTLYRHSHLFRLVSDRLLPVSRYMTDTVHEMDENEGLRVMVSLIQEMNGLCAAGHARFAVMLIPHGVWLAGAKTMPGQPVGYYAALGRELTNSGIPYVDLTPGLLAADTPGRPVFFAEDPVHLTPYGNRVVAGELARFLAGEQLLKRCEARR